MRTIIKSLPFKYLVNILLIVTFGVAIQTGLFDGKGGGGHRGRPNGMNRHQISEDRNLNTMSIVPVSNKLQEPNRSGMTGNFPSREKNNTHVYFGLAMVALMLFHTVQHWNWFKKFFTDKLILNNKLLFATGVFFVLMAISGIFLWLEIVPRNVMNFKGIHEFTSYVLIGLIIIHIIQKLEWCYRATIKLFKAKKPLAV
jgi:Domain of unknown function (DUF4405)